MTYMMYLYFRPLCSNLNLCIEFISPLRYKILCKQIKNVEQRKQALNQRFIINGN